MIDGIDWIAEVVAREEIECGWARAAPIGSRRARLSSHGRGQGSRGSALAATPWTTPGSSRRPRSRRRCGSRASSAARTRRTVPVSTRPDWHEGWPRRARDAASPSTSGRPRSRSSHGSSRAPVGRFVRTSSSEPRRRSRHGSPARVAATSRSPPTCSRPSPCPRTRGTRSAGRGVPPLPTSATSSSTPSGHRMEGSHSADAGSPTGVAGRSARPTRCSRRSTPGSSRRCGASSPLPPSAPISHRWGCFFAAPRDWSMSIDFDRSSGLARAGGYSGHGVVASSLAGRTLADLITGAESELTGLPWVGHTSRRWEPEPLRFLATRTIAAVAASADAAEDRTGSPGSPDRARPPLAAGTLRGRARRQTSSRRQTQSVVGLPAATNPRSGAPTVHELWCVPAS